MRLRSTQYAFKEWAVVCEALDSGRQSLILRKGGIHEGRDGFRVDHQEFWLYPTEFHQQPDVLASDALALLEQARLKVPTSGTLVLRNYVVVDQVIEIHEEFLLDQLRGLHVWSEATLLSRFHYRTPMLYALLVRAYRREEPMVLPDSPGFAGCRSWVDLGDPLPSDGLTPVLADDDHALRLNEIRKAIGV